MSTLKHKQPAIKNKPRLTSARKPFKLLLLVAWHQSKQHYLCPRLSQDYRQKKDLQRTISVFHRSLRSGVTIYANLRGRPYFIT